MRSIWAPDPTSGGHPMVICVARYSARVWRDGSAIRTCWRRRGANCAVDCLVRTLCSNHPRGPTAFCRRGHRSYKLWMASLKRYAGCLGSFWVLDAAVVSTSTEAAAPPRVHWPPLFRPGPRVENWVTVGLSRGPFLLVYVSCFAAKAAIVWRCRAYALSRPPCPS